MLYFCLKTLLSSLKSTCLLLLSLTFLCLDKFILHPTFDVLHFRCCKISPSVLNVKLFSVSLHPLSRPPALTDLCGLGAGLPAAPWSGPAASPELNTDQLHGPLQGCNQLYCRSSLLFRLSVVTVSLTWQLTSTLGLNASQAHWDLSLLYRLRSKAEGGLVDYKHFSVPTAV